MVCPYCATCFVVFFIVTCIALGSMERPASESGDSIDVSRQIHQLFHRLDIPIQNIPIGTSLPWTSFEALLVNHAVRKKSERDNHHPRAAASAEALRKSYFDDPAHHKNKAQEGTKPPSSRRALSPINVGKVMKGVGAEKNSARDGSARGSQPSPRHQHRAPGATPVQPDDSDPFKPALHSLSLMLVNDPTHVPTLDSTIHDMRVAIKRMDGMTHALSTSQPFRPRISDTAIEANVIYDPELRQISELGRTIEILRSDVATQGATIRRLEVELEKKRDLITHLRYELAQYRAKDPFSGDELAQSGEELEESCNGDTSSFPLPPPQTDDKPTLTADDKVLSIRSDDGPFTKSSPSSLQPQSILSGNAEKQPSIVEDESPPLLTPSVFNVTVMDSPVVGKSKRSALGSVRERFQNAVAKLPRHATDGPGQQIGASSMGSGAASIVAAATSLRARLSVSSIAAFREAVLDTVPRRHVVLGFEVFETLKQAAMFEASMFDRLVAESGLQHGVSGAFRRSSVSVAALNSLDNDDPSVFEDALKFFSTAHLRTLDPPLYRGPRALPLAKELYFLGIGIPNKAAIAASLDPTVWSNASQQALYFAESIVKDYGGHIIANESQEYLVVFDNARSALTVALEIQYGLPNTPNIQWPPELDAHPLAGTTRDLQANLKRYIWRGVRLGMCVDVVPSGHATCLRDIGDNGGVIYNGSIARNTQWIAANLAPAGGILLQERMRPHIEDHSVELDDPTTQFWTWRYLPGATTPTKFFDFYHRCQSSRRAENHHAMRLLYQPLQLRLLTDPDNPATLERLVMLHNVAAAKQGHKVLTRDDDSILGLEGTVEQRLSKLRELPPSTSEDVVRAPHEDVFLAHVPALANPPSPDGFAQLPVGDVCILVVSIPVYDDIVRFVDDALASSYARRIFRTCRELAMRGEFGSLAFVRSRRDRLVFVTAEPMDAIKYSLILQDQLFQLSPWSRDGNLPSGLVALLEGKKVRGKLICEGPAVSCAMHFSKAKPMIETYGLQQAYYVGSELSILEHLTFNAPENVNSVLLSDTMFAIYHARERELTLPQPFVECVGLLDRLEEPLRAVYNMTPRFFVSRQYLFPVACWYSYRRWVARRRTLDANSGGGRRATIGGAGSGVDNPRVRFSVLRFSPTESRALRHCYSSADKIHRARMLLPNYATLAMSNTITSTKTQTMCAKMFFDAGRREQKVQRLLLSAAVSIATNRGRKEDVALAESVERAAMEMHDTLLPLVVHGRASLTSTDFASVSELCGVGGASGGGSAFVTLHQGSASSMSTPKSSQHLNRSGSSRGLQDIPRRAAHPPPLVLGGGPIASPRGGQTEGDASPDDITIENHEVKALFEIDKERQFIVQRSRKIESEVRVTHNVLSYFVSNMESYVGQLLSTQSKRLSDEEFVLNFMRRINVLRDEAKRSDDSDHDSIVEDAAAYANSSSDDEIEMAKRSNDEEARYQRNLEKVRINERWQDSLASVVDHDAHGGDDYDPVLLCRSMIGLLCRHFLSIRTVGRRMMRVNDTLERAQRTMDPSRRIAKAVEVASERNLQKREDETVASFESAADIVQLGAIEEVNSVTAAIAGGAEKRDGENNDEDED